MSALAALMFDRDDGPDALVLDFIAALRGNGARVAGLVQEFGDDEDDIFVRDLETGELVPIMQNLGPEAEGCRVDPRGVAAAAGLLARARRTRPDLLIVNRFGRLESEGGGLLQEIGAAVADGDALLVCVPLRYRDAWNTFAGGLDAQLPPTREALETWWASLRALQPSV
jgi:hypothetical protein